MEREGEGERVQSGEHSSACLGVHNGLREDKEKARERDEGHQNDVGPREK